MNHFYRLDPVLYKRCHKDAEKYCHAKKDWYDKPNRMDPERGPIVLPCLYRYAYHPNKNVQVYNLFVHEAFCNMKFLLISIIQ